MSILRFVIAMMIILLPNLLFSQEDIIITRVRGDIAAINRGSLHGISKGSIFEVKRNTEFAVISIGRVKVVAVRPDRSAVKLISTSLEGLAVGDFLVMSSNADADDAFLDQVINSQSNYTASYPQQARSREKRTFSSIALGYGNSYGGLGARFQYNFPFFAFHAGVGYFPAPSEYEFAEPAILYAGGLKFYLNNKLYMDFQFGTFGIEAKEFYNYSTWYGYEYTTEQKILYGPSILIGGDWFGKSVGFNAAIGGSYNLVEISWTDQMEFLLALDLGVTFRLW